MVAHDATHPEALHIAFPNWIRTVPKLHNGRGCMHMKVCFLHPEELQCLRFTFIIVHVGKFLVDGGNNNNLCRAQIFYKTGRLRVVISTANLIDIDWRDIENVSTCTRSCDGPTHCLLADCLVTRLTCATFSDPT